MQSSTLAPAGSPPSEAEIESYLQSKLQKFAQHLYPDARLADFQFNEATTLVCGKIVRPGKPPLPFSSRDDTLDTADRPIGMPLLGEEGDWEMKRPS